MAASTANSPVIERGARILVTGANGFVGRVVVDVLRRAGYAVDGAGRTATPDGWAGARWHARELSTASDWAEPLDGVAGVVHLAAHVHQMHARHGTHDEAYERVNVEGTTQLARAAAAAGVRRFILMSSIKVNGERTGVDDQGVFERFSEDSPARPADPYARSKWAAEQALRQCCEATAMSFTTLRPPLVYGPMVGANFLRLLKAVQRGVPLPFAGLRNLRSLIYVGNLAEAVLVCLESAIAANKVYLVSDVDISTPDLVIAIARTLDRPPRLFRVPPGLLRAIGMLTMRSEAIARMLDSLVIDDSRIRNELFWSPSMTMQQGLNSTIEWLTGRPATPTRLPRHGRLRG